MTPESQLLIRVADLWLAQIKAVLDESPDNAEIRQELNELTTLRNNVDMIVNGAQAHPAVSIPQTIIEYLQIACPECEPIKVEPWERDPRKFHIETSVPMTPEAYAGLGSMYPGMLVVDYAPVTRRIRP